MSVVTNVILTGFSLIRGTSIAPLQKWMVDRGYGAWLPVHDEAHGDKYLEMDVLVGAFNYFPTEEFVELVFSIPWDNPETVQLLICEQHEYKFKIYDHDTRPNRPTSA